MVTQSQKINGFKRAAFPAGGLVMSMVKQKKEFFLLYKVIQMWHNIVLPNFKDATYPLKLVKDRNADCYTLHIVVCNGGIGSQFYYVKESVLYNLQLLLGKGTVGDIRVVLKPFSIVDSSSSTEEKKASEPMDKDALQKLAMLKDVELRESCFRLLQGISSSR